MLTTRAQALGRLANRIEVNALDQDAAALLVLHRAGLLTLDASLAQAEQALTLYQQALAIREQRLRPEHPRALDTRARYVYLLRACGRSEEAAPLEKASH